MTDLSSLDYIIFFASLIAVMGIGLWAGRKEESSLDFFLAGKETRWWGVAGSIFGSNVSANHMIGMMGLGFSVGFAQSQFEITAIAGLLMLCYGFLPVYRKLNIYTLSEYLTKRYGDSSRVLYAVIMLTIMVVIMMVPGFYIGSRTINILIQGGAQEVIHSNYVWGIIAMAIITGTYTIFGGLKAVIMTDFIQSLLLLFGGLVVAFVVFSQPEIGGWGGMIAQDNAAGDAGKMSLYRPMNHPSMPWTGMFTGLMFLHFYYWGANQFIVQRALSARSDKEARTGIIAAGFFKLLIPFFSIGTGVAAFYLFKAKGMTIAQDAVFPTILTQFVSPIGFGLVGLIAAGVIGAILSSLDSMMNSSATIVTFDFYKRFVDPKADDKTLILLGRIFICVFILLAAGITIFAMDPNSKDSFFLHVAKHQMRLVAGVFVAFFVGMLWKRATALGGALAIIVGVIMSYSLGPIYDSALMQKALVNNSSEIILHKNSNYESAQAVKFATTPMASSQDIDLTTTLYVSHPTPENKKIINLHVSKTDAENGLNPIVFNIEKGKDSLKSSLYKESSSGIINKLGTNLNFFHATAVSVLISFVVMVIASLATPHNEERAQYTWTGLGGYSAKQVKLAFGQIFGSVVIFAVLAIAMLNWGVPPAVSGILSLLWTWGMFLLRPINEFKATPNGSLAGFLLKDDRTYAGLLGGLAVFLMFYYV